MIVEGPGPGEDVLDELDGGAVDAGNVVDDVGSTDVTGAAPGEVLTTFELCKVGPNDVPGEALTTFELCKVGPSDVPGELLTTFELCNVGPNDVPGEVLTTFELCTVGIDDIGDEEIAGTCEVIEPGDIEDDDV